MKKRFILGMVYKDAKNGREYICVAILPNKLRALFLNGKELREIEFKEFNQSMKLYGIFLKQNIIPRFTKVKYGDSAYNSIVEDFIKNQYIQHKYRKWNRIKILKEDVIMLDFKSILLEYRNSSPNKMAINEMLKDIRNNSYKSLNEYGCSGVGSDVLNEANTEIVGPRLVREKYGNGVAISFKGKEYRYVSDEMDTSELMKKIEGIMRHQTSAQIFKWLNNHALLYYTVNESVEDEVEKDDVNESSYDLDVEDVIKVGNDEYMVSFVGSDYTHTVDKKGNAMRLRTSEARLSPKITGKLSAFRSAMNSKAFKEPLLESAVDMIWDDVESMKDTFESQGYELAEETTNYKFINEDGDEINVTSTYVDGAISFTMVEKERDSEEIVTDDVGSGTEDLPEVEEETQVVNIADGEKVHYIGRVDPSINEDFEELVGHAFLLSDGRTYVVESIKNGEIYLFGPDDITVVMGPDEFEEKVEREITAITDKIEESKLTEAVVMVGKDKYFNYRGQHYVRKAGSDKSEKISPEDYKSAVASRERTSSKSVKSTEVISAKEQEKRDKQIAEMKERGGAKWEWGFVDQETLTKGGDSRVNLKKDPDPSKNRLFGLSGATLAGGINYYDHMVALEKDYPDYKHHDKIDLMTMFMVRTDMNNRNINSKIVKPYTKPELIKMVKTGKFPERPGGKKYPWEVEAEKDGLRDISKLKEVKDLRSRSRPKTVIPKDEVKDNYNPRPSHHDTGMDYDDDEDYGFGN